MATTYNVKIIQEGNRKSLIIPPELPLLTEEFTLRQENGKLILEPVPQLSLLELLATFDDEDEDFPDVDQGLLPLDDINL